MVAELLVEAGQAVGYGDVLVAVRGGVMGGDTVARLLQGVLHLTPGGVLMMAIGGLLVYLAVAKEYEPMLLLPIGAGCILANLPLSPMVREDGAAEHPVPDGRRATSCSRC